MPWGRPAAPRSGCRGQLSASSSDHASGPRSPRARGGADALVVSLGLDAAAEDPESPLQVTAAGYRAAGERIGRLGPAALIQEGGYDLASLGGFAVAALTGVAAGMAGA